MIVAMRTSTKIGLIVAVQAGLVVLVIAIVASRRIPLGIPGEWEWQRVKFRPEFLDLLIAALAIAGYCGVAGFGFRALRVPMTRFAEALWLLVLLAAAVAIQVMIPWGAASGYDLAKWALVPCIPGSTGYYEVAKKQAVSDPWKFLADYPVWIQSQDSLHIGTHPPGLVAVQCLLLRTMGENPRVTELLVRLMPFSTTKGFQGVEAWNPRPVPRADRAALYAAGLLTLLACSATVVPLYLMARTTLSASVSWAAAAFWPLVPAANLFQPDADTAYPFLATLALALAVWAVRPAGDLAERAPRTSVILGSLSGMILAVGMFFTLAFLPVGLIVGLVIASSPMAGWRRKLVSILAVGAGFLLLTAAGWSILGANPIPIWDWNLKNHARFYVEYPRTYAGWLVVNPVELAIALGLPAVVWAAVGLGRPSLLPTSFWATLVVLVLLNVVGRNMGEVARLWLLFMPPLLLAAGSGLARLGGGSWGLAVSVGLLGLQTLALQALIQVVYPV
jgi:hypothetical protein